ncbi:hypothetical protein FNV43_RR23085 [Rhamnella rubrinervis]|uniref:E3 ubiquitin-protein ligase PRT1 n=1 Tax=Rhamnella rubrinervis TaxID=2594499 RepID=A0A8K0DXB0_9ROSA|nr:hypothetical protein FNV43_RR23085 [Rhamnella rubrinervis]
MEDQNLDAVKSEEISDSFVCCVCLDLLYKPIVLHCGHVSCFWCVHKSMSGLRESHCPICRHPYNHFPTVCQMLHFLLLKMYPLAYKARELQILEEEKEIGSFSPQFDADAYNSQSKRDLENSACGEPCVEQLESSSYILANDANIPEQTSDENPEVTGIAIDREKKTPQNWHNGNCKQISIEDVLCAACKQLLFRPVVLNCGHVYCESCTVGIADETIKCQVCQSSHPKGLPKVCLEFGNFLQEQFPEEYALRRDAVQLKQVDSKNGGQTTSSSESSKQGDIMSCSIDSKVHIHVGCDVCGMYPIVGDRYRCKDCVEIIGFDLCGDCYNSRSKLPGRFNQKHTPEHKFELVSPNTSHNIMLRLVTGQIDGGSTLFITDYASENSENGSTPRPLSGVSEEDTENIMVIPATSIDDGAEEDLDDSQTTNQISTENPIEPH